MTKYLFSFLILVHGLIHLVGYSKAFHYSELKNITVPISKPMGLLWITSCLLFIITAVLIFFQKNFWWTTGLSAVILSQVVIMMSWKDAKYGTIANILILLFILWKKML